MKTALLPFPGVAVAVLLGASWLACGGTAIDNENGPGGSGGATGGSGGTGGGGTGGGGTGGGTTGGTGGGVTGGSGGTGPSACESLAGTYTLEGTGFSGEPPWVWIHDTSDFGCSAIVASTRHAGRRYEVMLTATSAMLTPLDEPAIGGYQGLTDHHLTEWNAITLEVANGQFAGPGKADVILDWNEEDIWGEDPATLDLTVAAAEAGNVDVTSTVLPWRKATVLASRPTSGIAMHLDLPDGAWTAEDEVESDAEGVIEAELSFAGVWDDVRGQTVSFTTMPSLVDVSGAAMATTSLALAVYDIGPALAAHEMSDVSTVATYGLVESYTEGDCALAGCVIVRGYCGSYSGLAGQLRVEGATQAVLAMRLESYDSYVNTPAMSNVEVVAEDGTRLVPTTGGTWDSEQEDQTWVYDVTGHTTVGFAVEAASYCHGWGGPIIVDAVTAQ